MDRGEVKELISDALGKVKDDLQDELREILR
eukprot:COSAG02_NODE_52210_length_309_cov_0.742857_1_plen_30_part_10